MLAMVTGTTAVNSHRVLDVGIDSSNQVVITMHYDGGTKTVTVSGTNVPDVAAIINSVAYARR